MSINLLQLRPQVKNMGKYKAKKPESYNLTVSIIDEGECMLFERLTWNDNQSVFNMFWRVIGDIVFKRCNIILAKYNLASFEPSVSGHVSVPLEKGCLYVVYNQNE